MDVVLLALPAFGYVLLQFVAMVRLDGLWRRVSLVSAMVVAALVVAMVAGDMTGWHAAHTWLGPIIPTGLGVLTLLLFLSEAARFLPRSS